MMGADIVFWVCLVGATYSYFLYPAILWVAVAVRGPPTARLGGGPRSISFIIAARNEQGKIAQKLENTLSLRPAKAEVEILVASDASDDATDDIVRKYGNRGVKLVRSPARLGKEHAQALAITSSGGEVLVFTDAGTILPPDSLREIERAFVDTRVGAVSSVDRFLAEDGETEGEGLYVRYEMWLRSLESRLKGLVGLSGSFFAARREICQGWDTQSPSDFNTALSCARAGLRAISDPSVVGMYQNLANPAKEHERKVRTVIRGITAVARNSDTLNPFRFGVFSWQVWSHKIMRWAVPFFLLGMLVASTLLAFESRFFFAVLLGQVALYATALLTHFRSDLKRNAVARLAYFFVLVNLSILEAVVKYALGRRMTTWKPSVR